MYINCKFQYIGDNEPMAREEIELLLNSSLSSRIEEIETFETIPGDPDEDGFCDTTFIFKARIFTNNLDETKVELNDIPEFWEIMED